jgi:hypothetical protein
MPRLEEEVFNVINHGPEVGGRIILAHGIKG